MTSGYAVQYLDSGELSFSDCLICNNSIGNSLTVHTICATLTINFREPVDSHISLGILAFNSPYDCIF